jgi:hypothetical protein
LKGHDFSAANAAVKAVLKGHDFSRAANAEKSSWALQAAEKLNFAESTQN